MSNRILLIVVLLMLRLMEEQAAKTIASSNKQVQDLATTTKSNINAAALNAIASKGSVETFPLVRPADTNSYCGVYIYMDELGMLKKLPSNKRASSIAEACGYHSPPPNFYGDVFVGRVQTKPTMMNVDFKLEVDTDRSTAEWIQRAPYENLAWQQTIQDIQTTKNTKVTQKVATPPTHHHPIMVHRFHGHKMMMKLKYGLHFKIFPH